MNITSGALKVNSVISCELCVEEVKDAGWGEREVPDRHSLHQSSFSFFTSLTVKWTYFQIQCDLHFLRIFLYLWCHIAKLQKLPENHHILSDPLTVEQELLTAFNDEYINKFKWSPRSLPTTLKRRSHMNLRQLVYELHHRSGLTSAEHETCCECCWRIHR